MLTGLGGRARGWVDRIAGRGSRYLGRNLRSGCICGAPRSDIAGNIYRVTDNSSEPGSPNFDRINPRYHYRCPACGTFSAPNIYFPADTYEQVELEDFNIPDSKRQLNRERVRRLRQLIGEDGIGAAPVLYDLGSGEGAFTECFVEAFAAGHAFACEADVRLNDKFYGKLPRTTFIAATIEDWLRRQRRSPTLPPPDLVAMTDVMEHLTAPEQALDDVAGVLRPGGHALFVVPNAASFADPAPVPAAEVDWNNANRSCQHLWMYEHDAFVRLVATRLAVVHADQEFETAIRRDSVYTTVIARKA